MKQKLEKKSKDIGLRFVCTKELDFSIGRKFCFQFDFIGSDGLPYKTRSSFYTVYSRCLRSLRLSLSSLDFLPLQVTVFAIGASGRIVFYDFYHPYLRS